MSMDGYGVYLDGLDLTDEEKINLIQITEVIVTNVIDNLFKELNNDSRY